MGGEQVVQIRHLHGRGTGCSNQTPLWDQRLFKSDTSMGGEQVVQIRHLHGRGTGCSNQTPPWEGNRLFKPDASMGGEQVKLSWCMDHLLLKQPTSVPASIAPPGKPALCGSSAQTCHLHGSFHNPLHKTALWRSSSAQTAHLSSFYSLPGKPALCGSSSAQTGHLHGILHSLLCKSGLLREATAVTSVKVPCCKDDQFFLANWDTAIL